MRRLAVWVVIFAILCGSIGALRVMLEFAESQCNALGGELVPTADGRARVCVDDDGRVIRP